MVTVRVHRGEVQVDVNVIGILALVVALLGVVLYHQPVGEVISAGAERLRGHP